MKRPFLILCAFAVAVAVAQNAAAIGLGDSILIDLGLTAEESSPNWNNVSNPTGSTSLWPVGSTTNLVLISNLVENAGGNSTGVGLDITVGGSGNAGMAGTNNASAPTPSPFVLSASRDLAVAVSGSTVIFRLTGLDDSLLYNFSFLSTINTNSGTRTTRFTINGVQQTIDAFNNSTLVNFTDIATNGSGIIDIGWRGDATGQTGILNGMQIVAVPEGDAWLMITAGLAGLIVLRRRRMRQLRQTSAAA